MAINAARAPQVFHGGMYGEYTSHRTNHVNCKPALSHKVTTNSYGPYSANSLVRAPEK
jgi:hypothetical protein